MNITEITWKRFLRTAFWVATALLAINLGRMAYTGLRPVRAAPAAYTVMRTDYAYDKMGILKHTTSYVDAVRSDGSHAWSGSDEAVQQRDLYFANGDHVQINDRIGKKSTFSQQGLPAQRDPQSSCTTPAESKAGWTPVGIDTIGVYRAVRVTKVGRRTMTVWYALDLGCATLQARLEHETGVTEQKLSAVVLGEPNAALFEASRLEEVAPSHLYPSSLPELTQQRLDKTYNDNLAKVAGH